MTAEAWSTDRSCQSDNQVVTISKAKGSRRWSRIMMMMIILGDAVMILMPCVIITEIEASTNYYY